MGTITLTQPVDLSILQRVPSTITSVDQTNHRASFTLDFNDTQVNGFLNYTTLTYLGWYSGTFAHLELSNGVIADFDTPISLGNMEPGINTNEPLTIVGSNGDDLFKAWWVVWIPRGTGDHWVGGAGNDTFVISSGMNPVSINGGLVNGSVAAGEVNTLSMWSNLDVTTWDVRNINHFTFDWGSGVILSNTQIKAGYVAPDTEFDGTYAPRIEIRIDDGSLLDFSTLQFSNWQSYGQGVTFSLASSFTPSSLNLVLTSVDDTFSASSITGPVTVAGGAGNDTITGGSGANTLSGGAGDDNLNANATGAAANIFAGDAGDDRLSANSDGGSNALSGGAGDDNLQAHSNGAGNNNLTGDAGSDYLSASSNGGNNTLTGGDGNDNLQANTLGAGTNNLSGDAGDDSLNAWSVNGNNTLTGGGGHDNLQANATGNGNNILDGGAGDDQLTAFAQGTGTNTIYGGDGNDFIGVSGSSINTITGGAGDDSISFSGAGNGVITGGDGNDYISGDGNSSLNGNSTGNYAIDGGAGNDYVESGEGNDTITGGSGRNHLSGGVGDDLFIAGSGIDKMSGGDGNDLFTFAAGTVQTGDAVFGGIIDEQDTVQISADLDLRPLTMFGVTTLDINGNTATVSMRQVKNSAVDEIKSSVAGGELVVVGNANLSNVAIADDVAVTMNGSDGDGANTLVGGTHDEIINGLGGNDTLLGNEGDDVLNGGAGGDKIYGGDGDDTILLSAGDVVAGEKWWGGFGDDTVKLLSSTDASAVSGISSVETVDLNGFAGTFLGARFGAGKIDTVISTAAGAELITIGKADLSGVDVSAGIKVTLNGAAGNVNDVITGASVAAAINGLDGNDTLKGLAGADTIAGGAGQDLLIGGLGKDNLTGGAGADVFDFDSVADSAKGVAVRDTIIDFSRVEGDKIDLSNIDASAAAAGDQAFSFLGSSAFSGVAGQLRYAAGVLMADVNGDKVADLEISLANKFALKVGDFVL